MALLAAALNSDLIRLAHTFYFFLLIPAVLKVLIRIVPCSAGPGGFTTVPLSGGLGH